MDKKTKKIYSIKGTIIPPSPIHVVPDKVEFIANEDTYHKEILCSVCEEPVRAYTPTDYACPKCHSEKFNGIEKDQFYRKFLTHEEQMVGAELFQKSFVGFQKEEPKPECDHIVGVTGWVDSYCYDGDKVKLSELLKNDTMTRNLYDLEDIKERFYFCHKKGCGQAIDWEEIEKKLNTTK